MTRAIRHWVCEGGGEIVTAGTPEDIVKVKRSYTQQFCGRCLSDRKCLKSVSKPRNKKDKKAAE